MLSVAAGFALVPMNPWTELREEKECGLQFASTFYSPRCFIINCFYGETG